MIQFTPCFSSGIFLELVDQNMGMDAARWLENHMSQAEKAADYTTAKVETDLSSYEADLESNRRAFQDIQTEAAAKEALFMYARKREDFADLMAEAAMDHLMDSVLTDDLFTPVSGFTPTEEEQANMDRAKATAEALTGLLDFLKHI